MFCDNRSLWCSQSRLPPAWLCWCFMWCDWRCEHSSFCSGRRFRWWIIFVALFTFCANDFAAYFADKNYCSVSFWNQSGPNLQMNKTQYMELFVHPHKGSSDTTESSLSSVLTKSKPHSKWGFDTFPKLNNKIYCLQCHNVYICLSLFVEYCVSCTAQD